MNKRILLTCVALASSIGLTLTTPALAGSSSDGMHQALAQNLDRNGDGKTGPRERKHARYTYNRIDVNDDGRIGARERQYASNLRGRGDRNNDGQIGPRERRANHKFLNRVDRRR